MKLALGFTLALSLAGSLAFAQQNSLSTTVPKQKRNAFRDYRGEVKFGMSGRQFEGDVVNARFSRLMMEAEFEADFTNWLEGNLAVTQMFTSGAASNLYAAPEGSAGTNGLFLDEVSLGVKPIDGVRVKGGILKVGANPISSLMTEGSWTAYSVGADQSFGPTSFGLSAVQGIPTAKSTSNRIVDEDTLPLYTAATLKADLKLESGFLVKAAATHFIFTDLAAQAAQDSQQIGSTVVGNSKSAFLYAYEYRGMEYGLELKQTFTNEDELGVKGSFTENTEAPKGTNEGTKVALRYMKAGDTWNSAVTLTGFEIQPDVLPATYTSSSYGFTNRRGGSLGLRFDNRKHDFGLTGSYTKADIQNRDAVAARFQGDNEIYSLGAEVTHDLF